MKGNQPDTVDKIMMSSPVTLAPTSHLALAGDMISLGRIRHIPVVQRGKLVGLLSERDLIGAVAGRTAGLKPAARAELLKSVLVKEIMSKRVVTITPATTIRQAARLMAGKRIGCLPVLHRGALVGLVTTTNLLRYLESIS